jgi:putative sterol carrier protein
VSGATIDAHAPSENTSQDVNKLREELLKRLGEARASYSIIMGSESELKLQGEDSSLCARSEVWSAMLNGTTKPVTCLLDGRLRVGGALPELNRVLARLFL